MKELEKERDREEMVRREAEHVIGTEKYVKFTAKLRRKHAETEEKRSSNLFRADPIDNLIDDICCEERQPKKSNRKKRKTLERPENWEIIAEHYSQHNTIIIICFTLISISSNLYT